MPRLFGAAKFDEALIGNIKAFQERHGLSLIDGEAGEDTVQMMYSLLNDKYKFEPIQLKQFKNLIMQGKSPSEAAKLVIDKAGATTEETLTSVQNQMILAPGETKKDAPLEHFVGTNNVKVIDPRTTYAHPKIHKWLSNLDENWIIGDISLPFGGSEHPSDKSVESGERARNYPEDSAFSHKKIRFNHNKGHKYGTHVDFQVPLRQGGFNTWNTQVSAEDIDVEKVFKLLELAKASQYRLLQ